VFCHVIVIILIWLTCTNEPKYATHEANMRACELYCPMEVSFGNLMAPEVRNQSSLVFLFSGALYDALYET
jgi:hypothetical protein